MSQRTMNITACKNCGRDVMWLRHVKSDNPAPIDPEPNPEGNVSIDETLGTWAVITRDNPLPAGRARYMHHKVTCPEGEEAKARAAKEAPAGNGKPVALPLFPPEEPYPIERTLERLHLQDERVKALEEENNRLKQDLQTATNLLAGIRDILSQVLAWE